MEPAVGADQRHQPGATRATVVRLARRLAVRLAMLLLAPIAARAQAVHGVVVTPGDVPVPGVVVLLVEGSTRVVARTMSRDRGEFRLDAPSAGTYSVRTLRIGYRPTTSEPIPLGAGDDVARRLVLSNVAFSLDTVRVADRSSCRLDRDSAATTFAVWEQARTALTATQLTANAGVLTVVTVAYERTLDRDFRHVRTQRASVAAHHVRQPWLTLPPDSLRRTGYVHADPDGYTTYYGPGLDMLLSNDFTTDHCFRLTSARDPSLVGIRFEPTRERARVAEIAGTLWLERRSSELRALEFRYANVPRLQAEHSGGDMAFARMPNGAWTITRWSIRMPALASVARADGSREIRVSEVHVTGGDLALAMQGRDTLYVRPPLTLVGIVADSATDAPIPGAHVTLAGTPAHVDADAAGRFAMPDVPPGVYTMHVRTPALDSAHLIHEASVTFADSAIPVRVRVPNVRQLLDALCGWHGGDDGIVTGTVYVRGDSTPRPNATVIARWTAPVARSGEPTVLDDIRRARSARTGPDGGFRLCGVPRNTALTIEATADRVGAASADVRLDADARMARLTLTLDPVPPAR